MATGMAHSLVSASGTPLLKEKASRRKNRLVALMTQKVVRLTHDAVGGPIRIPITTLDRLRQEVQQVYTSNTNGMKDKDLLRLSTRLRQGQMGPIPDLPTAAPPVPPPLKLPPQGLPLPLAAEGGGGKVPSVAASSNKGPPKLPSTFNLNHSAPEADVLSARSLAPSVSLPLARSTPSVATHPVNRLSVHDALPSGKGPRPVTPAPPGKQPLKVTQLMHKDMWAELARRDAELHKEDVQAQRRKVRLQKQRQREALDAQVNQMAQRRKRLAMEEQELSDAECRQHAEWSAHQQALDKQRRDAQGQEKMARDQQLHESMKRKSALMEFQRKEDAAIAQRIALDLEMEKEQEAEKRKREREGIERFLEYNNKQKELKVSLAAKELEADRRHQQEYLERLEQQDKDRSEALRRMYDRQTHQEHMAFQIQLTLDQRAQLDADKADRYAETLAKREKTQEEKRQQRLRDEQEKIKQFLSTQIREKETQRIAEARELSQIRDQMAVDVSDAEAKERARRRLRKDLEVTHRKELEEQMMQKLSAPKMLMTETEVRMNAELLGQRKSPGRSIRKGRP